MLWRAAACPSGALGRATPLPLPISFACDACHARPTNQLKQLIRPVRGFKTLKTAYATIKGFEVMRAVRKGQASSFSLTRDIRGEARLVERAFGLGPCALTEAAQFINQRLEPRPPDPSSHVGRWPHATPAKVCNIALLLT